MTPIAATTAVWVFILIPLLIVWAIGIVDIVRRDLPASTKAGWILLVLILPLIGTITYFLLRKPTEAEMRQAIQARGEHADAPRKDRTPEL
jgi:Phospholipase_D-nuclease N-terminal